MRIEKNGQEDEKERIKGLKRKRQRQEDKKKGQEDKKVLTIKMVVLSNVC